MTAPRSRGFGRAWWSPHPAAGSNGAAGLAVGRGPGHAGGVEQRESPGWVVGLDGPPRSGKSSIVKVIQERFEGPWMNLGVDVFSGCVTPPRYRPGIGR